MEAWVGSPFPRSHPRPDPSPSSCRVCAGVSSEFVGDRRRNREVLLAATRPTRYGTTTSTPTVTRAVGPRVPPHARTTAASRRRRTTRHPRCHPRRGPHRRAAAARFLEVRCREPRASPRWQGWQPAAHPRWRQRCLRRRRTASRDHVSPSSAPRSLVAARHHGTGRRARRYTGQESHRGESRGGGTAGFCWTRSLRAALSDDGYGCGTQCVSRIRDREHVASEFDKRTGATALSEQH
jgi:hypothetical protein